MKVAIYLRVSTTKQDNLNQELQLKEYVKNNKWVLYDIYKDIITGKQTSRPGFDRLFKDANKKLFDIVLFWDLSRFSRAGTYHTLMKLKELDNLNIKWVSYNESYINSLGEFRDIIISIMIRYITCQFMRIIPLEY
jgi:DNA invertase Pin-like site-specific DNA recombinase